MNGHPVGSKEFRAALRRGYNYQERVSVPRCGYEPIDHAIERERTTVDFRRFESNLAFLLGTGIYLLSHFLYRKEVEDDVDHY